MKVQFKSPYFNKNYNYSSVKNKSLNNYKNGQTLESSIQCDKFYHYYPVFLANKKEFGCESFLNGMGRVTIDDYNKIKKESPQIIEIARKKLEKQGLDTSFFNPKVVAKIAYNLKKFYDNKFNNNYQIISIGTSPASICEALESLGCRVFYMPITDARNWLPEVNNRNYSEILFKYPNLKKSLNYVKKHANTDCFEDKKTIIIDYCSTGATLRKIGTILAKYLNIPLKNVYFASLIEEINKTTNENNEKYKTISNEEKRNFTLMLVNSLVEDISNVPHYLIKKTSVRFDREKENLYSNGQFDKFSNPLGRAFSLCVIDDLQNLE